MQELNTRTFGMINSMVITCVRTFCNRLSAYLMLILFFIGIFQQTVRHKLIFSFNFSKCIKYLSFLLILCVSVACTSNKNYAPVRSRHKNLTNHKYYIVKQGDTLYSIGFRSGHDYKHLSKWNKISWPYDLKTGQKIKLFQPKQKLSRVVKKNTKNKAVITKRNLSQKTSTISKLNKKMLRLYWQWPIKGKTLKSFTQSGNKGIDISGKLGQKVSSASSGKVVYSGSGLKGYGKLLIIKHNYLYLSAYANNRRLLVKEGQLVKKGQLIAEVGQAGNSKPLLHFEIRKNGKPVNPFNYLPKK